MASSHTVLMWLVASAYSIAQKTGMIVRRVIAEGHLGIVEKTCATDLQTKADRLVQMSICSSLAWKFPNLTITGEADLPSEEVDQELIEDGQWEEILKQPCPSQYSAIREEDLEVWVDPLDGTKEYMEGLLDNVTVLIGIAYEGKAIAGIINQPYYNYQLKEVPTGKHIIPTIRSHSSKLVTDCVTAMNPEDVLRVGGAGNKCMMYGYGDDQNPDTGSVDILEELIVEFIPEVIHKAMSVRRQGQVQVEDSVFLIRKDPRKFARVKGLV